jgi:hypothetical protein
MNISMNLDACCFKQWPSERATNNMLVYVIDRTDYENLLI